MDQPTLHSIYLLLLQSLVALTNENPCPDCLSSIRFKLNPLYWPDQTLQYGLEKYFGPTSLKSLLFENLLRINHNCRFYLEESLYRLEIAPQVMIYKDLYDSFIEVLLDLKFGIFYAHVPRICDFSTLTEYGLQVKIKSIQRFFYPRVKDLIVKLSKYSAQPFTIKETKRPCGHEKNNSSIITFLKEDQPDRTGPVFPSISRYHFCQICRVNESKTCLH